MRYRGPEERGAGRQTPCAACAERRGRSLTVLTARSEHLDDVRVVDLLQQRELRQQVAQLAMGGVLCEGRRGGEGPLGSSPGAAPRLVLPFSIFTATVV